MPSDFKSTPKIEQHFSPEFHQIDSNLMTSIHSESVPVEMLFPQEDHNVSPNINTDNQLALNPDISSMNQSDHDIDVNQIVNDDTDEDVHHMGFVDYDDNRIKFVDGNQSGKSYNHGNKDGYKSGSKIKQIVSSTECSSTSLHKVDFQSPKEEPQSQSSPPSNNNQDLDNNLLQKSRSDESKHKIMTGLLSLSILLIIS